MKTVRTVLATLAGVLLVYSLSAWICVRADAAFVQRTIYQGFDQTFIIALVMGVAFLLITVILSVAIASANAESDMLDEEDEEEEEELPAPRHPARKAQGHGSRQPEGKNLEDILREDEEPDPEKITFAKPVQPEPQPEKQPAEEKKPVEEAKKAEVPKADASKGESPVYCIYCGSKVSSDSAFCPKCGKKL